MIMELFTPELFAAAAPAPVAIPAPAGPFAHLTKRAQDAHNWTSFSPERRGEQLIKDAEQDLAADLAQLPEEAHDRYKAGFERNLSAWINSKSNTYSVMITGGGGFNNAHHEKRNRWEHNSYERFQEYRARAVKAILRSAAPKKTVSGELEQAREKLAGREAHQVHMKRINAAFKKYTANPAGFDFTDFTETERAEITADVSRSWYKKPYGPFEFTNNNAEIKRLAGRVALFEKKEARAEEAPAVQAVCGEGWKLVQNNELDRIQIIFDGKPDEATRTILKGNGFKWAPSQNAWQRQMTANAFSAVRNRVLPNLPK